MLKLKEDTNISIAFLITTLVVVATPGTGAVYSINAGLFRGTKAGIVAAFGCTLGVIPHMIAATAGLASILNTSAIAFETIKWLGVAYLLFLAWQTLRDKSAIKVDEEVEPQSFLRVIRTAILINLLNPKLTIFFFAFLPQFVPIDEVNGTLYMVGLSLVFMGMTFIVFALYGVFAAAMLNQVVSRPKVMTWLRRTFAGTYILLAVRLVVESR